MRRAAGEHVMSENVERRSVVPATPRLALAGKPDPGLETGAPGQPNDHAGAHGRTAAGLQAVVIRTALRARPVRTRI